VSLPRQEMRKIVYVSRQLVGESLRAARAIKKLKGVMLLGVCEQLPDEEGASIFAGLIRLDDAHDAEQLTAAAGRFACKHGAIDRIVTATETLLPPVARASEALGLQGLSVAAVTGALDKSCLKAALERNGINTARDRVLTGGEDARQFVAEVGFPVVLKPLGGSGALATLRARGADELELALELMRPTPENPVLAEAYLSGQELCIDTITIANEPRFHSVCCYHPPILEAVEDPRIQWTCVMPRDITGHQYREFIEQGLNAVRALSVGNAMTHMEGFLLEGGRPCFTDATLRPAGARIGPMLAFAYDIDPYLAWARVAVDDCFDGPWERKYAVGTIFLRGIGSGAVEHVRGLESVTREVGGLLVESRLPRVGAAKSATYTGDGYITVRHPETRVVEDALRRVARIVRITYTNPELPASPNAAAAGQWSHRMRYFDKQLTRPAWDDDSLPSLNNT
jgi:biotin carboxylase